jgi:positive control factor
MQDLLKEYKKTRKILKDQYDQLRDEHTPKGYRVPLKNGKIKRIYDGLDCRRQIIGEMISDVDFVIEWLETGRRPGNRRGIERQAAYQRERLMDPVRMQAFAARSTAGSPANITEWEHQQIEDALCELSERERECFELAYGQCFSHAYIAEMLNISVSSVETYIKRANAKVSERVKTSLFLAV